MRALSEHRAIEIADALDTMEVAVRMQERTKGTDMEARWAGDVESCRRRIRRLVGLDDNGGDAA